MSQSHVACVCASVVTNTSPLEQSATEKCDLHQKDSLVEAVLWFMQEDNATGARGQ